MLEPETIAASAWKSVAHPVDTVRGISAGVRDFANASIDDQITTITRIGIPLLLGSAVGKLATASELPITLGNAPVTVSHFTSDAGVVGIANTRGVLRRGTYVTTPSQIPANASSVTVEKLLEIAPGKGANSVTFKTEFSNLAIPANGRTTSGGAIQFQLKTRATADPTRFKMTDSTIAGQPTCFPSDLCGN